MRKIVIFAFPVIIIFMMYAMQKTNQIALTCPLFQNHKATSHDYDQKDCTPLSEETNQAKELPKPTRQFSVGTTSYHLIDYARKEPHLDNDTENRELLVQIWYPAEASSDFQTVAYLDPKTSQFIKQQLSDHFSVSLSELSCLDGVKTHTVYQVPISQKRASYPIIIFSPGFGAPVNFYSSILEELASHGYVVAAISYPYITSPVSLPNGRIINQKSLKELQELWGLSSEEEASIREQEIWVRDISFVLKHLELLNENDLHKILTGKLDLTGIGMFGHSFGGGVSLAACSSIKECKAVATLDGRPRGPAALQASSVPTLMVGSSLHPPEKKEQFNKLWEAMKGPSYYAVIKNAFHGSFTDLFLFIPWKGQPPLKLEPMRAIEVTRALLVAFFDRYLKGEIGIIEGIMKNYPEIGLNINREAMRGQKPFMESEILAIKNEMKSHYG